MPRFINTFLVIFYYQGSFELSARPAKAIRINVVAQENAQLISQISFKRRQVYIE
jgi:hypothetical protein